MRVIFVDYIRKDVELARANMVAVPREGEIVSVELSLDPLSIVEFKVRSVKHEAKNTLKVEEWMNPYDGSVESGMVILRVEPYDKDAETYVYRLLGYKDGEG